MLPCMDTILMIQHIVELQFSIINDNGNGYMNATINAQGYPTMWPYSDGFDDNSCTYLQ